MADITLHSGSFCDRNNNEISITFFKRTSTPVMTVDPTALSFTSNGGTKQLRVSNYTGTLSISVTGGTGWLSRTQSTSSGVRTYTFTATANTSTTMRNATITLTDSNSTVTVGVTQAGAVSNVTVNPNYLVFNKTGETKTTTVTWTGGSTPTWSNTPEWASITSSVSGNTMTLTINVGPNTTQYQRTGMVYVTNGISRADLSLEQEAVHTVSVQPSSFTFPASGGTQVLTISDIQGSFSMNYEGDGLSVILLDYPSSTSRRYNVTYTPNTVTATRTGVINVSDTAGGWVAVTTTQAANTDTFAVSPTSFQYGGTGSTNTFTFTGVPAAGISYDIPSGVDWVTVSNLTNASVDITTAANQSPTSRTTTVKFYDMDDIDNYVTVTVNQEAGQSSLSVVPSSITYLPAGGTYGITATWTAGTEPTATITYVQGDPGWMTPTGSGTVTGNTKEWAWTASSNYDSSSRTALIRVTNGLQTETVTVSQSSAPSPVVFSVAPSTVQAGASGQATQVTITGAPSSMGYDVTYGSGTDWTHISNFSQTGATLVISANTTASQRTATVKFYDQDDMDNYVTVTITQDGTVVAALSVRDSSMSFTAAGGRNQTTVENIVGTLTTTQPNWITLAMSGEGGTRLVSVHAASNTSTVDRSGAVVFDDDRLSPVSMEVEQEGFVPVTVAQSLIYMTKTGNNSTGAKILSAPASGGNRLSCEDSVSWITDYGIGAVGADLFVFGSENNTSSMRSGSVYLYDRYDHNNGVSIAVTQLNSSVQVLPSTLTFTSESGTQYVVFHHNEWVMGPYVTYPVSGPSNWINAGTAGSGRDGMRTVSVTSNSGATRTATITYRTYDDTVVGTVAVTQAGTTPSGISVSPSSIDFPYTNDAETLTVSGVPSGGYSTSISYNTGASGWLNLVSTAYNIIVTASTTTYPSSRTATLTVTNASVPSDSVAIPITQAGNPQVLSVTPNAWNYPSSLGTHTFTITYNASGSITYTVAYDREEGEEEIDWIQVELVSHTPGSENWEYSIDVAPNNTGSGREAMVTFTGDGGGADEVSVYQQP